MIERRTYAVPPHALFGACLTALGQMRAHIERRDVEHGTITATFGGGLLTPASELVLRITRSDDSQTQLSAAWRGRSGGRRMLATFLEMVDTLVAAA